MYFDLILYVLYSDKLAMRNICGVQGSLISELSSPVFFQHYLITFNKYNLKELKKSLYDRVQGKGSHFNLVIHDTQPAIMCMARSF